MKFLDSRAFAVGLDKKDPLRKFRNQFYMPEVDGRPAIYFCGNSLGLQPKATRGFIEQELHDWSKLAVEGHFHAKRPWLYYHRFGKKIVSQLVGAKPIEVVAMNQLTVNLHLMLTSFYNPEKGRYKIITESGAFSSDQYALESQIRLKGFNPESALIELSPRPGEYTLRTEDILKAIKENGSTLSLVIFGGVQYYSGQFFRIKEITQAAHDIGAFAGFDLAHAVGNVPLHLHNDNVDFAVWCSYKYMNSGPGSVAGTFVHERHAKRNDLLRLAGWWGHQEKERFKMKKGFQPMEGADGWQLSNFPILSGAAYLASLSLFEKAGIKNLRKKSITLTGYLEFLLQKIDPSEKYFTLITPKSTEERGCQISILMKRSGRKVFDRLTRVGVIADWREPDVIRIAPVPLYNTFEEVFMFSALFRKHLA